MLRKTLARTSLKIVVPLAAVVVVGACGGESTPTVVTGPPDASTEWNTVLADADKDGSVVLRSAVQGTVNTDLKAAFESEYPGIEVTIESSLPTDLTQKVDAEHAAGQRTVDVLIQTDRAWHEVHDANFFAPILGPDVAGVDADLRGEAASDSGGATSTNQLLYDDNTLMVLGYSGLGYSWNKDVVSGNPSFESLFADNTFEGRVGIVEPDSTLAITNAYALWLKQYPDMFEQLGQLNPTYYPSGQALAQAMAAGAVDVGFPSIESVVAQTSNLEFGYDLPAPAFPRFGEVLSSAPHPNAAQVFVNWLATRNAQQTLIEAGGSLPVVAVPGGLALENVQVFDVEASSDVDDALATINKGLGR